VDVSAALEAEIEPEKYAVVAVTGIRNLIRALDFYVGAQVIHTGDQ
jgi:hypothetical protein